MFDMLMKLFSLSFVKGMEIGRGNWLIVIEKRFMLMIQYAVGREKRGLGVKRIGKLE